MGDPKLELAIEISTKLHKSKLSIPEQLGMLESIKAEINMNAMLNHLNSCEDCKKKLQKGIK